MEKLIFNINHTGGSTGNETIKFVVAEYLANEKTVIEDLFPFFDDVVKTLEKEKTTCKRFCHFDINGIKITAIDDFNLLLFIKLNNIDKKNVNVDYCYGGVGGSEYINDKLKIYIPSSEKNHLESPHIHVSNCKGDNVVVFYLSSLEIRDGKDNWDKYFSRKEKKQIINCLEKYQNQFIDFYNDLSKGIVPHPVEFLYGDDEKIHVLRQDNDTW